MKLQQRLTLPLLVVISLLATMSQGMPQAGSTTDDGRSIGTREPRSYYVIYSKDSTNKDREKAISKLLGDVASDPKSVSAHGSDLGVAFWSVSLTPDQAKKVGADPNVSSIVEECTHDCPDPTSSNDLGAGTPPTKRSGGTVIHKDKALVKRDDGYVNSHKIDPEMVFISLPDGAKVKDHEDFVYDRSAGRGIMVYIVDTGADLRNDDEFSTHVRTNVRWLHASGSRPLDATENDIRSVGHGTGILAKAAGWKHGIAKRSNPVVVRVNQLGDPAAYLDGVIKAYNDWRTNHYIGHEKTATGILNMSWGWNKLAFSKINYDNRRQLDWTLELRRYLKACIAIGLIPITPSGNSPKCGPHNVAVDEYPQLFAYGNPPDIPEMMVVGGVDIKGALWKRSKVDPPNEADVIQVYAPCHDLTVPNALTGGYRVPGKVEGTSYASGTIAGLGAYFLGLSSLANSLHDNDPKKRVKKLKDELQKGSCIHRTPKICSLHNLADPGTCPPDIPPGFRDGDEVNCKDTSSTSANTVVAIPGCFIATVSPIPRAGINAPHLACSCQGDTIAGIGSGTVSGTTYSWCQTGGLPKGVPPEATKPPVIAAGPVPATTTAAPVSRCVQATSDAHKPRVTCSTSTKRDSALTPLPKGNFDCTKKFCLCQMDGKPQICETLLPKVKREVQPVVNRILEPTATPIPSY